MNLAINSEDDLDGVIAVIRSSVGEWAAPGMPVIELLNVLHQCVEKLILTYDDFTPIK